MIYEDNSCCSESDLGTYDVIYEENSCCSESDFSYQTLENESEKSFMGNGSYDRDLQGLVFT